MARSPRAWACWENESLKIDPNAGIPVCAASETFRFVSAHSASKAAQVPEPARHAGVFQRRRTHGDRASSPISACTRGATHEGGAALEGERDHRDAPAVVLVADTVGHRDPHLVQEELGELGRSPRWCAAAGSLCRACPSA